MPDCEISFDMSRIDFRTTSDLLMTSYWGNGRSDEFHRRAFANSLCAGAYINGDQVGFGRAITDRTVFAYLADIIIWPQHRSRALACSWCGRSSITLNSARCRTGACRPVTRMAFMRSWASRHRPMVAICGSIATRNEAQARAWPPVVAK